MSAHSILKSLRLAHPFAAAALGVTMTLGAVASAVAAVPTTVRESGRILDKATSQPVSGQRTLTFRLYPSESAVPGEALWSEVYLVDFVNGRYSVQLGSQTALDALLRSEDQLWLGVTLDGGAEFSPRNQLAAVPYARLARDVAGVINPESVRVGGVTVIDARGNWVGPGGVAGPAGPAGPQGPAGVNGTAGAPGPVGPAGANGVPGAIGPPGIPGAAGPQGPVGAQGATGPAGPAGAQGPVGATGAAGPQGLAGLSYRNSWDMGSMYAAGDVVSRSGASYVAIALSVGQDPAITPASWGVLSDRGATGPAGATGAAGPAGPQGVAGPVGPQGLTGATGATGAVGPAGPQGVAGAVGSIGPQGIQGLTGAAGANGQGVPSGGAAGQVLTKVDGTNFNTQWATPAAGGGGSTLLVRATANTAQILSLGANYIGPDLATCFGNVLTNVGSAFDSGTGVFTAPSEGLYLVSVQTMSTNNIVIIPYIDVNNDFTNGGLASSAVISPDFMGTGMINAASRHLQANNSGQLSVPVYLTAGQVFSVRFQTSTSAVGAIVRADGATNLTIVKL